MADGTITRNRIIQDDAINWGEDYAKNVRLAKTANEEFVATIITLNAENTKLRRSENQTDYLKQKNEAKLATDKVILSLKEQQALEVSLEKIKQESIRTDKAALGLESQKEAVKKRNTQLTIEERVQNEVLNKALKQQARENLGLVGAYEQLNKKRTEAKNKLADLLAAENQNTKAIKAAQKEYDVLNQKVLKVDKATDNYTKNIGNYKSAFNGLGGILSNLVGAFGIVGGVTLFAGAVKNIFDVTKELQSLDLALKQVTATQANYADQQAFLKRISESYGVEIKSLTKTFTQFYVSAKDKIAGKEIQQIFESVTKAGATMGLSVESQERAFLALNQMMSKGTIQAEELRGQLGEALPGSLGIMAKALGVTEVQLGKMMKDGKLLAADVLPKFARQLEITYGIENTKRVENLAAAQNRLSNSWTDFVRSLNDSDTGGISAFFAFLIGSAAKAVTTLTDLNATYASLRSKAASNTQTGTSSFLGNIKDEKERNALAKITQSDALKWIGTYNEQLKKANHEYELFNKVSLLNFSPERMALRKKALEEQERLNLALGVQRGRLAAANQVLGAGNQPSPAAVVPTETEEEKNKRLARLKKELDEYLKLLKKRNDDTFALDQFRYEREIYYNQLIVDDEKKSSEERVNAYLNIEQLKTSSAQNVLEHELKNINLAKIEELKSQAELSGNLESFSKKRIDLMVAQSNKEIELTLRTGKLTEPATKEQLLAFERYKLELDKITQDSETNRQKLIDVSVAQIQKKIDADLQKQNIELNNALTAENTKYSEIAKLENQSQKEREDALKEHERRKLEITRDFEKQKLAVQLQTLENEINANDSILTIDKISTEKRIDLLDKIAKLRKELTDIDVENTKGGNDKKEESDTKYAEAVLQKAQDVSAALTDFANALFDGKIANIDAEINAVNDSYDKQIKAAGNDQRKKDLLQKEKERKDAELEKRKKKIQHDQAVFNKVMSIAQIAMSTAIGIMQSYAQLGPIAGNAGAIFVGAIGALEIATVLATPIPKYKDGRLGGKEEIAVVGDGYVNEVITAKDGSNPRLTPSTPTLTRLMEGERVFKSKGEYEKYLRASILTSIDVENNRLNAFQAQQSFDDYYSKEILSEMKRQTKAIEKGKPMPQQQKAIDLNHELWKMANTRWN